jgi:glycosyltransferase 2 family protein
MKKGLSTSLRVFVSFALLGGLFWVMREKIGDTWRIMLSGDIRCLMAALFFLFLMVIFLSVRLKIVFRGEDLFISLKESTELTCVGFFFNNFMPTAVGGDIVKAHYASHFNKKRMKSYASVFMDRIIGMLSILLIAAAALIVDRGRFESAVIRPMVVALLVFGVVGILIVTNRSIARYLEGVFRKFKIMGIGERLNEAYSIIHDYRNRPFVVARSVMYSVIVQTVYCVVVYFLFFSMGKPVGIGNIFLIMPVVIFVSMLPSIGGLGVREYAMVVFFSVLTGKEVAFAVSLLALSGNFLISIAGGVIYLGWSFKPALEEVNSRNG